MASNKTKARNFAFIIYPESIPSDWIDCLSRVGVPMAISPLHDLDEKESKNLTDEEQVIVKKGGKVYKKAHYHVLYLSLIHI